MGLLDFLKGNKKRRKRGGRSAQSLERRPDEGTIQIPHRPPTGGVSPNPFDSPNQNFPARPDQTIARVGNVGPPSVRAPIPPPPTPQPGPIHRPPPPPNADKTQYVMSGSPSADIVVGVLVVIDGDLQGQVFKVLDGENQIGRSESSTIVLASPKISRSHALLEHQDGMFYIKSLTEKNPIFLNDTPTEGDVVGDGDTIRLGATTLKFRSI